MPCLLFGVCGEGAGATLACSTLDIPVWLGLVSSNDVNSEVNLHRSPQLDSSPILLSLMLLVLNIRRHCPSQAAPRSAHTGFTAQHAAIPTNPQSATTQTHSFTTADGAVVEVRRRSSKASSQTSGPCVLAAQDAGFNKLAQVEPSVV